jgi:uncharacterized membrane protein YeaQ/YmgE (transglycosylase-associated protein family)
MSLLSFLVVGLIAGWLAGTLSRGGGFGVLGNIVIGIVGASVGGSVFQSLGIAAGRGMIGSIIVATIGALVLIFVIRLIKRV